MVYNCRFAGVELRRQFERVSLQMLEGSLQKLFCKSPSRQFVEVILQWSGIGGGESAGQPSSKLAQQVP